MKNQNNLPRPEFLSRLIDFQGQGYYSAIPIKSKEQFRHCERSEAIQPNSTNKNVFFNNFWIAASLRSSQ